MTLPMTRFVHLQMTAQTNLQRSVNMGIQAKNTTSAFVSRRQDAPLLGGTGAQRWCLSVADEAGRRLSERSPHGVAETGAAGPNVAGLVGSDASAERRSQAASAGMGGTVSGSERSREGQGWR